MRDTSQSFGQVGSRSTHQEVSFLIYLAVIHLQCRNDFLSAIESKENSKTLLERTEKKLYLDTTYIEQARGTIEVLMVKETSSFLAWKNFIRISCFYY